MLAPRHTGIETPQIDGTDDSLLVTILKRRGVYGGSYRVVARPLTAGERKAWAWWEAKQRARMERDSR